MRHQQHYGLHNLKFYLAGDRKQRQLLVAAAEKLRMMPTVEGSLDMKLDLTHVIDGFHGNEHNFPLQNLYQDVVQLVARTGINYTPTLIVAYGGPQAENWYYTRENPHDDPKLTRFIPPQLLAETLRSSWFHDREFNFAELAAQAVKIYRAGGKVTVGAHGQLQGLGYHWEMWSLAAGGFSNCEVLQMATLGGAQNIAVSEDLGSIEAGKLADVLVLTADPLKNIRNTTALDLIIRNGEIYDADTLDRLWPDPIASPELWWHGRDPAQVPLRSQ